MARIAPPRFYADGDRFLKIDPKTLEKAERDGLNIVGSVWDTLSVVRDFKLDKIKYAWIYTLENQPYWRNYEIYYELEDVGNGRVVDKDGNEWSYVGTSRFTPYERPNQTETEMEFLRPLRF